jgi:hypothetical protein
VASKKRVSVEDEEAVYLRLRKITELIERLPPSGEIQKINGAMDYSITVVQAFAGELHSRAWELDSAMRTLQETTKGSVAKVRSTVKEILEKDEQAREQIVNLSAANEQLGQWRNTPTGR